MTDRLDGVRYAESILQTIGNTPLVRLNHVTEGIACTVLAKVEYFNPGGSVKDRIGVHIIQDEIRRGNLKPGGTIVECTSGNTGVGLALTAAVMGYRAIFTMPDKMSQEKIRLLRSYGAQVITCPTAVPPDDPRSYYSVARRIVEETPGAVHANQYFNPLNPDAHYKSTGPEIWQDTGGKVDVFVAGLGTGGTISGTGHYLKDQNSGVKVVGVDPEGSILGHYFHTREKGQAHPYLVEGIGEDIVPDTCQFEWIDDVVTVGDRESFQMARRLAREEGLMVGGSCGSAVVAALRVARDLDADKIVVVLLPDTGERYLSKFHSDEWMAAHRMLDTDSLTLGDIVRRKPAGLPAILDVEPDATVEVALTRMKEHNVSQLPVRTDGRWVGRLVETELLDALFAGSMSREDRVGDVMRESFPILDAGQPYRAGLERLIKEHSAILVGGDDGKVLGILTRYDMVDYMLSEAD